MLLRSYAPQKPQLQNIPESGIPIVNQGSSAAVRQSEALSFRVGRIHHAWTELDGKIIDLAVYGNTHFPPFGDLLPSVMPQVNKEYGHADVSYYPDKFDDDFSSWGGHITLGMNMADYMDNAPKRNALWNMALYCLDMSPTADNLSKLKATASKYTIGKSV